MIQRKTTGETFSDFPAFGKHGHYGNHYGSLVLTHDNKVLYFYVDYAGEGDAPNLEYSDVTAFYDII